ncbi:AtMMH-1 [Coprinellus micaceus]|uniref:AtMMH-1 n=1 Tax=Coprinellus micaceus TaxID=71717 RepID=A0A4Y7TY57_COPMI|nr:AtMMH-1 [Coprinellus micaceus]
MPELPEVERAAKVLRDMAKGKRIESVETFEDAIVFSGTTHEGFKNAVIGRVVADAQRYGKVLYMTLGGKGKHPVLHFGMTGVLQVRGNAPTYYRENGRKKANVDEWPPRFTKFVLRLVPVDATEASSSANSLTAVGDSPSPTEIAFLDPRRLARIRLCSSPLTEAPISELGFDPILSMPPLETFAAAVHKRSCPIKALLLDQSFSAGVGNWVADEILYHARVHPEQRCNTLSNEQIKEIYEKTIYVPRTAVDVNADDSLFPDNWLFKHRWGKGKKKGNSDVPLLLPSGEAATIKWVTVGGRTSAFVVELQFMRKKGQANLESAEVEDDAGNESDLTPLEESSGESSKPASTRVSPRKRKACLVLTSQARLH